MNSEFSQKAAERIWKQSHIDKSIQCEAQIATIIDEAFAERLKKQSYMGCFTGDCPHKTQQDCWKAIGNYCAELESENDELQKDKERLLWASENPYDFVQATREVDADIGYVRLAIDTAMKKDK